MKTRPIAMTLLAVSLAGLLATGCRKEDGPFEEAGEEIDEAVDDAKRKAEDITD
jgi:hypothetical protein